MKTRIIVTGMHRSGTSMVAGILKLCGVYFGDNLLHPQKENPKGFFEDLEFLEINKEILACSGGSWYDPPSKLKINQNIKEKIKAFLRGWDKYSLVGFKDPRCSITLPVWADYINNLQVVICERAAEEIALSLANRNGFSEDVSLNLIAKHQECLSVIRTQYHTVDVWYAYMLRQPIEAVNMIFQELGIKGLYIPTGDIKNFTDEKLYRSRVG